jgi:hypothetical protein
MATFGSYRDSGKTSEIGISRFFSSNYYAEDGVVKPGHLLVSERGAGANKSVDIAAGDINFFEGSTHSRLGWSDAIENVTITDNASGNPRIDAIVAYWDEAVVSSASSDNPNVILFVAVAGTPGASPTAPNDATIQSSVGAGNPFLRLADVDVANGFTSTVNADIEDRRTFAQTQDAVDRQYSTYPEYIASGLLTAVPGSGLTATTSAGYGYVRGYYVRKDRGEDNLYTASKDTYVDINNVGAFTYTEVANGAAEPAVASNSIRLCKVVSNGTDVTSVTDRRNLYSSGYLTNTADLNLSTSNQTVTGLSTTFNVSQASILEVEIGLDIDMSTGTAACNLGDSITVVLDIDGSPDTALGVAKCQVASLGRRVTSFSWTRNLASGAHTVIAKAANLTGNRGLIEGTSPRSYMQWKVRPGVIA